MQALPPHLDPDYPDLGEMVMTFDRVSGLRGWRVWGVLAAGTGLLAFALGLFLWEWYLLACTACLVASSAAMWVAYGARVDPVRLVLTPGRLHCDEQVHGTAGLVEVRWDCDPPVTTLVLVRDDGSEDVVGTFARQTDRLHGVTRKQRSWLREVLLDLGEEQGTRADVPHALDVLTQATEQQ